MKEVKLLRFPKPKEQAPKPKSGMESLLGNMLGIDIGSLQNMAQDVIDQLEEAAKIASDRLATIESVTLANNELLLSMSRELETLRQKQADGAWHTPRLPLAGDSTNGAD